MGFPAPLTTSGQHSPHSGYRQLGMVIERILRYLADVAAIGVHEEDPGMTAAALIERDRVGTANREIAGNIAVVLLAPVRVCRPDRLDGAT